MQPLFYSPLTLPFTLNLFLKIFMIITITTITITETTATTTISYPRASPWLSRREVPSTIFTLNNNNDDGGDNDDDDDNDEETTPLGSTGSNSRGPPEVTWLRIWRPLDDPASSPRGHLLSTIEDDQNSSFAAANWDNGDVPQIKSRAVAVEVLEFNGIEDFTIKLLSPSAGSATVHFRRGVNLRCFEDPDRQPGMWICLYKLSKREHARRLLSSKD